MDHDIFNDVVVESIIIAPIIGLITDMPEKKTVSTSITN